MLGHLGCKGTTFFAYMQIKYKKTPQRTFFVTASEACCWTACGCKSVTRATARGGAAVG